MSLTLFLMPNRLDAEDKSISYINKSYYKSVIDMCKIVITEDLRSSRQFFKLVDKDIIIDNFGWFEFSNKNQESYNDILNIVCGKKNNIILMSEAGCPCVADPGEKIVNLARTHDYQIKPLVGGSSIILALMASGFNGQQFKFNGYLPIKEEMLKEKLKQLERDIYDTDTTQIFIETPYRNDHLIKFLLASCKPSTRLCIASLLTTPQEYVNTKTIAEWKKENIHLHKQNTIFLLYK